MIKKTHFWGEFRRKIKYTRRHLVYLGVLFLMWLVRRLPYDTALNLGKTLGYLAFYLARVERNRTLIHLELAFGKTKSVQERIRIARGVFQHFGIMALETILLPSLSKEEIDKLILNSREAEEKLLEIYKKGNKIILMTAHSGNWELMGAWASGRVPLSVIARRLNYSKMDELMVNFRHSVGMKTLYSRDSPRNLIRALQQGDGMAILPDQDLKRMQGIFVPFFGELAYTTTGPISLALITKTPMVPAYGIRSGKGHKILVGDPLVVDRSLPKDQLIYQLTLAWTQALEKHITKYPDQWCWNHRRWKTRPKKE